MGYDKSQFPDDNHPLRTPDTDLQSQIVERIELAKKGNGSQPHKKDGNNSKDVPKKDGNNSKDVPRGIPMDRHPQVSNEKLGYAWGMKSTSTARNLVKHPEDMTPFQVGEMCDVLGVTLGWLRGTEAVNAYGVYEEPGVVADLYDTLTLWDKAIVCRILERLAGADTVRTVKAERRIKRNQQWYDRHKPEAAQIRQRAKNARVVADALGLRGHQDIELFLRFLPKPDKADG